MGRYGFVCLCAHSFNKHLPSIYTVPEAGCTRVGRIEKSPYQKVYEETLHWGDTPQTTNNQIQ